MTPCLQSTHRLTGTVPDVGLHCLSRPPGIALVHSGCYRTQLQAMSLGCSVKHDVCTQASQLALAHIRRAVMGLSAAATIIAGLADFTGQIAAVRVIMLASRACSLHVPF